MLIKLFFGWSGESKLNSPLLFTAPGSASAGDERHQLPEPADDDTAIRRTRLRGDRVDHFSSSELEEKYYTILITFNVLQIIKIFFFKKEIPLTFFFMNFIR
ncbi:hypothetical protein [Shimazuella soli]|uniref:hypothetical protein n=1 Tax=Shimazuella soli TaxID=1892854 RepID=UPI001F0FC953|nr:hypothetical protein [Shimazuella soli]